MKKSIVLLLLIVSIKAESQACFYDAIKLKKLGIGNMFPGTNIIQLRNNDSVFRILKYYVLPLDSSAKANVGSSFTGNPFLQFAGIPHAGNIAAGDASILSSIGGLDVTNLADALARFLVKRAKQELTIAFFDKFNQYLEKYDDLKTVFPNTYLTLTVAGQEIYNYQGYLQTLRESFQKDLDAIDKNLPSIIANHAAFFNRHPELAATLNSGCYLAGGLKDEAHPGNIIADYPAEYLDALNPNWKGAIQTLQLFSVSLRDTAFHDTTGNYWVSAKQIRDLIKDKTTFRIYLGLLYQQAKIFSKDNNGNASPILFNRSISLNRILDSVAGNIDPARALVTAISQRTEKLNSLLKNNVKPATDSLAIEQYYSYFNASVDLLKQCTKISDIPAFKTLLQDTLSKSMNDYFDVAQSTADIIVDIARRNYSSVIVNTVHVYNLILVKNDADPDSVNTKKKVMGSVFKYGSFMAATLQAKSSKDIENTIEAFALPQGSSRIKRESAFNVSVNGYAGLFYGHEFIKGINDKLAFNAYGVAAPVGVAASVGHSLFFVRTGKDNWTKGKRGWSTSLFVSVIDLGAVAAYRVKNDSVAQVPTIHLRDIFSPGAFLSIGIPKSPVSFNMGAQFGPNLRKVDDAKNDYSNKTYVRLSASLCVDIPVLNLYTRSR